MKTFWCLSLLVTTAGIAFAQTPEHDHGAPPPSGWQWTPAANLFAGQNDQYRKFTDFHVFESQNWLMLEGRRRAGRGTLRVSGMLSLEALTLRRLGSPQVFQTGETLDRAPLIDYQHPHDVLMQLAARYDRPVGAATMYVGAAVVGEPTLGPTAFMHRASAAINPQVPLAHHYLDSTHITPGVLSAGISRGEFGVEVSVFRGREPDEDRWDVDLGRLDSWAVRGTWARGALRAQFSGAHLTLPESFEPFDMNRLTASLSYVRDDGDHPIGVTIAWGQNREFYGNYNAGLIEAVWRLRPRWQMYTRGELMPKNILTAGGLHPAGQTHPHIYSLIGALTMGARRDLITAARTNIGIGADITGYVVAQNLNENYGSPWSTHVFVHVTWMRPHVH